MVTVKTRRPLWRKMVRLGGIIAIAGCALVVVIVLLMETPLFKQRIVFYANRQASATLMCSVTIGQMSIRVPNGLTAKNIVLSSESMQGTPLSVERLVVNINPWALLRGRLEIPLITVIGLHGELVRGYAGLYAGPVDINKITAPEPKPTRSIQRSHPIIVHMICAERCTVSYVDTVAKIAAVEIIHLLRFQLTHADSLTFAMQAGTGHFWSDVWNGSVQTFDVEGAIKPSSIEFKQAVVHGDSVDLWVHGTIPFSDTKPWDLAVANSWVFLADFPGLYKNGAPLQPVGKILLTGAMTGSITQPVVKITATGYELLAGTMAVDSLFVQANYVEHHVAAKTRLWSPRLNGDATMYSLVPTTRRLPDTLLANIRMLMPSEPASPINLMIHLINNTWDMSASMNSGVRATSMGTFFDSGVIHGAFQVQVDSIPRVISAFLKDSVRGSIDANGTIDGALNKPEIKAAIQIGHPAFGRYKVDTISVHVGYTKNSVQWQSLVARLGNAAIQSTGVLVLAQFDQSVTTDCQLFLDDRSAGTLAGSFHINKDSAQASATIKDLNTNITTLFVPDAQRFAGVLNARGTMVGTLNNPTIQLGFTFEHADSNDPAILATGDIAYADNVVQSTIQVSQKGSAHPITITAYAPVSLHELPRSIAGVGDGTRINIRGNSVVYDDFVDAYLPVLKAHGTLSLRGSLEKTNGAWMVSCSTHVANLELTIASENLKAGETTLDMEIAGPLVKPDVRYSLSGTGLEYRGNTFPAYVGDGSLMNGVFKLDTLHITSSGGGSADIHGQTRVSIKNGISFDKNTSISLALNTMPLAMAQPFLPDAVAVTQGVVSGKLVAQGAATGYSGITGALVVRNMECNLFDCDKPLGPLSVDIECNNNQIIVRGINAKLGGGHIAGSATAELGAGGLSAAHCTLKIKDVRLDGCYENLDLGIQDATIDIAKDSLITITADVRLADTRLTQDFSLVDIGNKITRKKPETLRPQNPWLNRIVLHSVVDLNSNLTFDSNLGKMVIDGKVTVAGRLNKPSIAGRILILNGFVYYLDRKFTVTQGTIQQYDPEQINPTFDISASSPVSWYPPSGGKEDYEITLLIKGTISNPSITLSAVPSLSQPQIVTLLTLGTIEPGVGSDLGSRTGSLVSQQLAGFGTRKLARILGVESVDIYGNVFGPSTDRAQVSVTKQVSSRVAVTYTKGLSRLSQNMVLVSYRILPFLFLDAESDQQAQGGIDLKFKFSH